MRCLSNQAGRVFGLSVLFVLVLYGDDLNNWWSFDDPQILKHAIQYSPHQYFFVPEAWGALIISSLTPWLTLAYDIDFFLFGFNPAGFYAHSLLAIAGCGLLIYLIARHWVDDWHALGGAMLFLVGPPIAFTSQQLMARHYIEGLLFYLLALLIFIGAMRTERRRWIWLAGVFFAIAASAKEIYLPLGLLPFLLPIGIFRQRLRMAWPFLAVMFFYVPWRWYMLQDAVGGYTPAAELAGADWHGVLRQLADIPGLLLASPRVGSAGMMLIMALAWLRSKNRWGRLLLALVTLVLLLAPLVPLALVNALLQPRLFVGFWAVTSLGSAIVLGCLVRDQAVRVRALSLFGLTLLAVTAWHRTRELIDGSLPALIEQQTQGMALAAAGGDEVFYLTPKVPSWYASGLIGLRPEMGRSGVQPILVWDEINLAGLALTGRRVLGYDPATRGMVDITARVPDLISQWRKRVRDVALSVDMEYDRRRRTVLWRLAPDNAGSYTYLGSYSRGVVRVSVPARGALRTARPLESCFRFRLDVPEGGVAYTLPLSFPSEDDHGISRLAWHGRSDTLDRMGCTIEAGL